jgi:hypothetical protein
LQLEREANSLLSYSANVKNGGVIPPLPHWSSCRGASLLDYRNNFIFVGLYCSTWGYFWDMKPCSLVDVSSALENIVPTFFSVEPTPASHGSRAV